VLQALGKMKYNRVNEEDQVTTQSILVMCRRRSHSRDSVTDPTN